MPAAAALPLLSAPTWRHSEGGGYDHHPRAAQRTTDRVCDGLGRHR